MASGHARACGGTAAGIPTSLLRRHRRLRLHGNPVPLPFAVSVFFLFFFLLAAACKLLTYILLFFFCRVWISRVRFGARRIFKRLGRFCCSRSCSLRPTTSLLHPPKPPNRTYNCLQRVDRSSSFHRYKSEFLSVTNSAASADCLCDQSFEVGGKESEDVMTC
jgi:hypothetical protein